MGKLTAVGVSRITKPGRYGDGDGLWLQVRPKGKSWIFRYTRDGKARHLGLGPARDVTLAEARAKAAELRRNLLNGTDPLSERREARARAALDAARELTFERCAERHIAAHEAAWRNDKHRAQWRSTLATYAYPVFGQLPVQAIDTTAVLSALEPIWHAKPETAGRVRGRIESVLDWATARGYRHGDNPARWRGHLDKLLPARGKVRAVRRHAALPFNEIAAFVRALREQDGMGARALEFAILTAARTGEVIGARWPEIDLDAAVWLIPAERMKGSREHRVPLSEPALALLKALPREAEFVFPGGRERRPLSNMALLATLKRMGRRDVTAHGFRSTFRDWVSEATAHPGEIAEAALAHVVADKTEAAYRRGDLFEKRRTLMADWAAFCDG